MSLSTEPLFVPALASLDGPRAARRACSRRTSSRASRERIAARTDIWEPLVHDEPGAAPLRARLRGRPHGRLDPLVDARTGHRVSRPLHLRRRTLRRERLRPRGHDGVRRRAPVAPSLRGRDAPGRPRLHPSREPRRGHAGRDGSRLLAPARLGRASTGSPRTASSSARCGPGATSSPSSSSPTAPSSTCSSDSDQHFRHDRPAGRAVRRPRRERRADRRQQAARGRSPRRRLARCAPHLGRRRRSSTADRSRSSSAAPRRRTPGPARSTSPSAGTCEPAKTLAETVREAEEEIGLALDARRPDAARPTVRAQLEWDRQRGAGGVRAPLRSGARRLSTPPRRGRRRRHGRAGRCDRAVRRPASRPCLRSSFGAATVGPSRPRSMSRTRLRGRRDRRLRGSCAAGAARGRERRRPGAVRASLTLAGLPRRSGRQRLEAEAAVMLVRRVDDGERVALCALAEARQSWRRRSASGAARASRARLRARAGSRRDRRQRTLRRRRRRGTPRADRPSRTRRRSRGAACSPRPRAASAGTRARPGRARRAFRAAAGTSSSASRNRVSAVKAFSFASCSGKRRSIASSPIIPTWIR